jgi:deoxyribose-phosphate aldolase
MDKNKYIDHTLLKAYAKEQDIYYLCNEAKEYNFKSVCVNPDFVSYAKEQLKGSDVLVCTVIGFPLGANTTKTKVFEAIDAINNGADEVDMVINISKVKDQDYDYVYNEIKEIKEAVKNHTLKVIIETCYLTAEEIKKVSLIVKEAKADFVKTSTGFGTGGATVENVKLIKEAVGNFDIKASGGIKTKEDFEKMVEAGATRIGTSNGKNLI